MVKWGLILQKDSINDSDLPPTSITDISFGKFKDNFFVKKINETDKEGKIISRNDYSAVSDFCKYYVIGETSSYRRQASKLANRLEEDAFKGDFYKKLNDNEFGTHTMLKLRPYRVTLRTLRLPSTSDVYWIGPSAIGLINKFFDSL